ncbi:hypothetical protein ACFPM0_01095 [Pseudonocardia sulfidoxydans]|uniref:hypothetical protein n=1 Tax=Pseudonocardia sulfidoxydans TaxID=54011 RepID=UPI0036081FE8
MRRSPGATDRARPGRARRRRPGSGSPRDTTDGPPWPSAVSATTAVSPSWSVRRTATPAEPRTPSSCGSGCR